MAFCILCFKRFKLFSFTKTAADCGELPGLKGDSAESLEAC